MTNALAGRVLLAAAAVLALAGCGGRQSVLKPESGPGRAISHLWWIMMAGACVGFGLVVFLLFLGWARRNRTGMPGAGGDRSALILIVSLGVVMPVIVLSLLFVWADLFVLKKTAAPARGSTSMEIDVIGHQWFWEVRYPGTKAVTANEIHIPVGTRVNLVVTTNDVIHSFSVPELNRKIDMIPGRRNRILLEADRAGFYRGQCTEFCGLQHAHMAVGVYADPPARFRAWLANEASPANGGSEAARNGAQLFAYSSCAGCHVIRGTAANGRVGPDLTHLASRHTLAALTIPNRPGELLDWIRNPQHVKPGNRMPGVALGAADFRALRDYLETLR